MELQIAKIAFVLLQFTNIVISSMLIISDIILFSYIKRVIHHVDVYIHTMIVLHILASVLILSSYELKSLDTFNILNQFLIQLTILTLVVINGMFQIGIYRFFHNATCKVCVINDFLKFLRSLQVDESGADATGCNSCSAPERVVVFRRMNKDAEHE